MHDPNESITVPTKGTWAGILSSTRLTRHPAQAAKLSNLACIVDGHHFPELLRIEFTDNSVRAVFPVKHLPDFSHDEQVKILRVAKAIAIVVTDGEETVTRQVWPNESHYDKEQKREGVLKLQSLRTIGVSDDSPMELRVHWEVYVRPPALKPRELPSVVVNASGLEVGKSADDQLGRFLENSNGKSTWG
jgi:hypothetical protein